VRVRHLDGAAALEAADWDRCFPADYPFTRHAFLNALEVCGCAAPATGWTPCHAVLEDEQGRVRAIAPLYLKAHSYGEFVFDFAWAQASQELGRPYYPRLVNAVPFTPVTGPRIGAADESERAALAAALPRAAESLGLSSFHALFTEDADFAAYAAAGCLERHDLQFHWRNHGYADFPAFLACLSSDKRKKLLRERRRVTETGLRFERRRG
jgi:predicted N-acyltransferase